MKVHGPTGGIGHYVLQLVGQEVRLVQEATVQGCRAQGTLHRRFIATVGWLTFLIWSNLRRLICKSFKEHTLAAIVIALTEFLIMDHMTWEITILLKSMR